MTLFLLFTDVETRRVSIEDWEQGTGIYCK